MILYSQKDRAYCNEKLPKSNETIFQSGCYLCAIATLGQAKDLLSFMRTSGAFVNGGLLVSDVLAKALGMTYIGEVKTAPKGWSIGVTTHYASKGVPKHFFLVNGEMMIDPLSSPAKIEPLKYKIVAYRAFGGIKLNDAIRADIARKESALIRTTGDRKIALTEEIKRLRSLI
jgi:hypothetical protein